MISKNLSNIITVLKYFELNVSTNGFNQQVKF